MISGVFVGAWMWQTDRPRCRNMYRNSRYSDAAQ